MMVQSSHQNGAAEIFLANNRAATAMVARATLTTLPSHTFHATLSSGGKTDMSWTVVQRNDLQRKCTSCNHKASTVGFPQQRGLLLVKNKLFTCCHATIKNVPNRPVGAVPLNPNCQEGRDLPLLSRRLAATKIAPEASARAVSLWRRDLHEDGMNQAIYHALESAINWTLPEPDKVGFDAAHSPS